MLACAKPVPLEKPSEWDQKIADRFQKRTEYFIQDCQRINDEFTPRFIYGADYPEEILSLKESINNYYIWNYIPENLESCLVSMNPY